MVNLNPRKFTITYTSKSNAVNRKIFGGERLPATYPSKRAAALDIAKHPMVFAGRNARIVKFKLGMKAPKREKKERKFKPKGGFLFKSKTKAQEFAENLRTKQGFRAEVQPSNKTTRKRSPSLKWVVFQGQKRGR